MVQLYVVFVLVNPVEPCIVGEGWIINLNKQTNKHNADLFIHIFSMKNPMTGNQEWYGNNESGVWNHIKK